MGDVEHRISTANMAKLVDAAFRYPDPVAYFDIAVLTFRAIGRDADATAVALMGRLYAEREIELLMSLRESWKTGLARDPSSIIA